MDLWEAFQRFSDGTHLQARLDLDSNGRQVQRLPLLVLDTQLYPKQCSVQPLLNSLAAAELARAGGEQLDLRQCVKPLEGLRRVRDHLGSRKRGLWSKIYQDLSKRRATQAREDEVLSGHS